MNSKNNPLQIWKYFFEDSMVELIVTNTNQEITHGVRNNYGRASFTIPTNENEVNALLGILIISGIQKSSKLNISELFCKKATSPEIFRLAMLKYSPFIIPSCFTHLIWRCM